MAFTSINKPSDYFNTVLYTGNGSTQSITGVNFQPDLVWIKNRNSTNEHNLTDVVRGATTYLHSNLTQGDTTAANSLTSFDSDGFSLGNNANFNTNTNTYVAWNWLAGGTASSNTDGSITSTVSANTTAGFSIVSWTHNGGNSTIGHGLGTPPQVVITKERNNTGSWNSYFSAVGNGYRMVLQGTNAKIASSIWNNTDPTSTVFSMNDSITSTMIAYCFAEKKGFSKFGSYTGNGSADGTFVYTGFKPAFFMMKRTDVTNNWVIIRYDDKTIEVNTNEAEYGGDYLDLISNGVKIRNSAGFLNASGGSYIYMAFAESPFTTSTGIPTTAR
jgi:hypothetical protein